MNFKDFNSLLGQDSYVRCRGKERIDPAIVTNEVADHHIFSGGTIGWWVKTGYIVVDIDEGQEEALAIIKKLKLKTLICKTPKGLHLYFKTNKEYPQKIKMTTPFGLMCDFRCANKGYVLLPFGASGRAFNKSKTIAELPLEFTPLINRKESLLGLKDGEGRNNTLFSHLMAYKHKGATQDQIDIMGDLINRNIFASPIDNKELNKILASVSRYEAKEEGENPYLLYNNKGHAAGVNSRAIVDYFVNKGNMFVLGGESYLYTSGIYIEASSQVRNTIREMIAEDHLITQSRIMECYRLLIDDTRIHRSNSDLNRNTNLINFKNGVFNMVDGTLTPHDSKYLQTIQIKHDALLDEKIPWNETRMGKYINEQLKLAPDEQEMLLDYMAYCLTMSYGLKTFMIFNGQSNTGKSVLIRFIENMIGAHNTSSLSMHQLNQRFYPSQLHNKLLNSCADNASMALSSIDSLKKITGGDTIMHEKKGKDPFFFIPFTKLVFSFNQLPLQLEEKSNAFYKRMRILSMERELYLNDAYGHDLWSDESIQEVLPHLLARLPVSEIPRSKSSNRLVEGLRQDSDSIHAFIEKICLINKRSWIDKKDLYDEYARFCLEHGREAHKYHGFIRHLRAQGFAEARHPKHRTACWRGITVAKRR